LALALALFLTSVPTQGQIFKCADSGGGITYQQDPCLQNKTLATLTPDFGSPDPRAEERLREYRRQLDANHELALMRRANEEAEARRAPGFIESDAMVAEQTAYWEPAYVISAPALRKPHDHRKRGPHPQPLSPPIAKKSNRN
jgi:hypothetical protein